MAHNQLEMVLPCIVVRGLCAPPSFNLPIMAGTETQHYNGSCDILPKTLHTHPSLMKINLLIR